ncbi:MAG: hypothetical protein HLUCCA01_01805 [Bacteroidetes bacterium HLUCCA01]|nr:MAG: hypothetical protein HLUCCA01_01805 [Bacteroidetes bacterium HLUCCA01]
MSVLAQTLLSLMLGNLCALSFLATWHTSHLSVKWLCIYSNAVSLQRLLI